MNWGRGNRFRPTARYSAAITACDFAQPIGNSGGIAGYRYAALNYPRPCSLDEASACLRPNEVGLLFAVGWDNEPATVILIEPATAASPAGGGVTAAALAASRPEILEMVEALTDTQTLRLHDRARTMGAEAYAMLLGPIADRIRNKDLVIVPTDALALLPFELLVEPDPDAKGRPGQFLLEKHGIRYAPSMTVLSLTRQWFKERANSRTFRFGPWETRSTTRTTIG